MARGRKTSLTIRLTPAERLTLLSWQRATTIAAGLARRGRIILLRADGMTITDITATVSMSRPHTYKWLQRFVQEGLEGLESKPGRGPPRAAASRPPRASDTGDHSPGGGAIRALARLGAREAQRLPNLRSNRTNERKVS